MSRKAERWDNAYVESFFGRLMEEVMHGKKGQTLAEAKEAVIDCIEYLYNAKRIQKRLGYLSPVMYEFERMCG